MIFLDLDNTIYNQEQILNYVFKEIGKYIENEYGIKEEKIANYLIKLVKTKTLHYKIFDDLIKKFNININIDKIVKLYREKNIEFLEKNKIKIYKSALDFVKKYGKEIIIYTEGNYEIQEMKIKNIEKNYKIRLNFEIVENKLDEENIKIFEKYNTKIYIGDDPISDFYIPNKLNIKTIRVLTGLYRNIKEYISKEYEPKIVIKNLKYIYKYIK